MYTKHSQSAPQCFFAAPIQIEISSTLSANSSREGGVSTLSITCTTPFTAERSFTLLAKIVELNTDEARVGTMDAEDRYLRIYHVDSLGGDDGRRGQIPGARNKGRGREKSMASREVRFVTSPFLLELPCRCWQ